MTEERLKQIESLTGMLEPGNGWREDIRELVAEVRRLQEELVGARRRCYESSPIEFVEAESEPGDPFLLSLHEPGPGWKVPPNVVEYENAGDSEIKENEAVKAGPDGKVYPARKAPFPKPGDDETDPS